MHSELKCPACGGTIAVDVHNQVIVCDTCGKAYKNPFYQPILEVVEVEEPASTEEQTTYDESDTSQDESDNFLDMSDDDTDDVEEDAVATVNVTDADDNDDFLTDDEDEKDLFADEPNDEPVDEPSVDVEYEEVGDTAEEEVADVASEVVADVEVEDDLAYADYAPTSDVATDDVYDEGAESEQESFGFEPYVPSEAADTQDECQDDDKSNKKHSKTRKKHVMSLVKASICLVLAVLMFAFSFLPIAGERYESNCEGYSGTDYIGFMFNTARHWDEEDVKDAVKIEKLEEKMEKLYEEYDGLDMSTTTSPSGKVYYKTEAIQWIRKTYKLNAQWYYSVDGYATDVEIAQITFVGLTSLIHVLFSGAMMILSAIAVVISVINLVKNEDKKFFFEKFHLLFPLGLFLSLAVLFGVYMATGGGFLVTGIVASFIARLFFECLAFALVIAERVVYIVKNKVNVRDYAFKALAIVLSLVAVGCCFAPAFSAKYTDYDDDVEHVARYKDSAYVLGAGKITQEDYEDDYMDMEHEDYLEEVAEEIDDKDMYSAIRQILLDRDGSSAGALSTGYFFMLLAIVALGGFATAQLFDEKQSVLARKVLAGIAIAFMLAALICAIVLVATVNDYAWEIGYVLEVEEIQNFKYMIDGGVICAFIISILALLAEILPAKILPRKAQPSVDEPSFLDEDFITVE